MARGITAFTAFWSRPSPGGALYGCLLCPFTTKRRRGNALAEHNRTLGVVKAHYEKAHPAAAAPVPSDKG